MIPSSVSKFTLYVVHDQSLISSEVWLVLRLYKDRERCDYKLARVSSWNIYIYIYTYTYVYSKYYLASSLLMWTT